MNTAIAIRITKLSSGYYHIRQEGHQNNFVQPPRWPCSHDEVDAYAFAAATPEFLREVKKMADEEKCRRLGITSMDKLISGEETPRITEDDYCRGCNQLADACTCCAECGEPLPTCDCPYNREEP